MAAKTDLAVVKGEDGPTPKRQIICGETTGYDSLEIKSDEEEDFYGFGSPETPLASIDEPQESGMDSRYTADFPAENVSHPKEKSIDVVRLLAEDSYWRGDRSIESVSTLLQHGRPTPILIDSSTTDETAKQVRISICEFSYRKIPWLTGSEHLGKYFCWPCLLFADERANEKWNLPSDSDWKESSLAILKHQMSLTHVQASKMHANQEQSMLAGAPMHEPESKSMVRNNRLLLELLIQILCSKKTKPVNTHKDFDGYAELMKTAISHDPQLSRFAESRFGDEGLFCFVSSHAENVLTSIEQVIYISAQKEVLECPHVTLMYEDTLNIVDVEADVAVIVKYVTEKGEVRERFLKFLKFTGDRSLETILQHHVSFMKEYMLESKLLGFSHSGTIIAPGDVQQFNNAITNRSPKSRYFPCPDHNIKELLIQSLSHIEESRYFFQVFQDLVTFFSSNDGAIPSLVNIVKTSDPKCPWFFAKHSFTHEIISTVHYSYEKVLLFFKRVAERFWDDEIVRQAPEFLRFLKKPENKFLIVVVASVLNCFSGFDTASTIDRRCVIQKLDKLTKARETYFMVLASSPNLRKIDGLDRADPELSVNTCTKLFENIIGIAKKCLVYRCGSGRFHVGKPSFGLPDVIKETAFWKRYEASRDELKVMRMQMDNFRDYEMIFQNKTIAESLKLMHALEMTKDYPEYYNFLRFCALLFPVEASPTSAVSRLKSYVKDKQTLSSRELLLHLERDTISELVKDDKFIEEVIAHFAAHNNEHSFLYD